MPARVLGRRQIYAGKVVTLELQTVELDDGRHAEQEVVVHRPSVGILPIDENGVLLLVRQFRAPVGGNLLEISAGSIDPGEDVEAAVQRELQEEVGVRAGRLERLGGFYLVPGYCDEFMHIYTARELTASALEPDEDELIEVERLSLDEALAKVASGEIQDVKSIAALLMYSRRVS